MSSRFIREIDHTDVGRAFINAAGRIWSSSSFIGRVLPQDVGKRIFLVDNSFLQVENDEQRARRLVQEKNAPAVKAGPYADGAFHWVRFLGDEPGVPGPLVAEYDKWWDCWWTTRQSASIPAKDVIVLSPRLEVPK